MTDFFGAMTVDEGLEERHERFVAFLEEHVAPVADEAWLKAEFPSQWVGAFGQAAKEIIAPDGYQWPPDPLWLGLMCMELGRVDPSACSFFSVHWGLAMGSILMLGSDEQKQRWLEPMSRFEAIGSFALSEPEVGSDASMGMRCQATREGDGWRLRGEKKWSGNASMADVIVVVASGPEREVFAFLVEPSQQGVEIEVLRDKISKRSMENVVITLDVWVPESMRLPGCSRFGHIAKALMIGRFAVAWEALGISVGAYEAALAYSKERQQFGGPIARFQLVQDKLVRMLSSITMMQCMLRQLANEARSGRLDANQAAMAKLSCAREMRSVVSLAREVLGGNGILLRYGVARLFADAEAVYSYEGTQEMNTLIVGKAITGISAFV